MYTTSCIAPVFVVHRLSTAGLLGEGTKVVLVSSEAGSITLRHATEGGGNYAHHASKTALNMVGKLLSLDLKDQGVIVNMVHPGFMRTEMTRGVGFDKYWDQGGGEFRVSARVGRLPLLNSDYSCDAGQGCRVSSRLDQQPRYFEDWPILGSQGTG